MLARGTSHPKGNKAGQEGPKELGNGNGRGEDGNADVAEDGAREGENSKNLAGIFFETLYT